MSSTARQNRVDPWGELIAVRSRGALMGNRGLLHDDAGMIRRDYRLKAWIACVLEFKGRHREVMSPGQYTELFFLDEVTSLAAGHRPCAECRRDDYNAFRAAWAEGQGAAKPPLAPALDSQLHDERRDADGSKRTFEAEVRELPDGTFAAGIAGAEATTPHLLRRGRWLEWSPRGYAEVAAATGDSRVRVLTPHSTVAAIAAGYEPAVAI